MRFNIYFVSYDTGPISCLMSWLISCSTITSSLLTFQPSVENSSMLVTLSKNGFRTKWRKARSLRLSHGQVHSGTARLHWWNFQRWSVSRTMQGMCEEGTLCEEKASICAWPSIDRNWLVDCGWDGNQHCCWGINDRREFYWVSPWKCGTELLIMSTRSAKGL